MAERPLSERKSLGAYYTDPLVVDFLVGWGMRSGSESIMDPSCGDGRFLAAASDRGASRLVGCDLDPAAIKQAAAVLAGTVPPAQLHETDFFSLDPTSCQPVDLVVGNPPFIRFQHFSGEARARALQSALRVGARLSRLTASWAPFLLHALQFLRPGGVLTMVVPAELAQTAYGVTTLQALCGNFGRVRLVTFRRNWFADAQQETFLLLAENKGGRCRSASLIPLNRIQDLDCNSLSDAQDGFEMSPDQSLTLGLAYLDPESRSLWRDLVTQAGVLPLRHLGEIANGYVSGANDFFHRPRSQARSEGIPADWLIPTARSIRSLRGLEYVPEDVEANEREGTAHHLVLPMSDELSAGDREALDSFIAAGEYLQIEQRYKCRSRSPWWQVPGLIVADLFLPYMVGAMPRSAVNRARAVYPNSLHGIRLAPGISPARVVFALLSSFTLLSMELEGRTYGGGVLKLEPSEMQRVRLIMPTLPEDEFAEVFTRADRLLRAGRSREAVDVVDGVLLKDQLGMSSGEISALASARDRLLERRTQRSKRSV